MLLDRHKLADKAAAEVLKAHQDSKSSVETVQRVFPGILDDVSTDCLIQVQTVVTLPACLTSFNEFLLATRTVAGA